MTRYDTQSCTEIHDRIPLYVGGDLDPEALEAVRAHLDDCESCARCAGDASRARQVYVTSFREREAVLPRPDLWAGIRTALVEEGRIPGSLSRTAEPSNNRPGRLRLVRRAASLAAAAAVLVFAGLHFYPRPTVLDVVDTPSSGSLGAGPVALARPDVSTTGLAASSPGSVGSPGFLRRVDPDQEGLLDSAGPLRYADQVHPMARPDAPGVPFGTELANYK